MQYDILTDETSHQVYTPEPFQISPKELDLTDRAITLSQRINRTEGAPISVPDVAMAAMILKGSGWLDYHFGQMDDFADPVEADRQAVNYYDALAALMQENPQYNSPRQVCVGDLVQFDAGTGREDAEF